MDTGKDLHRHCGSVTEGAMAVDLVCGMAVDPQTAKHKAIHQGRPYFFCCSGCKAKFEADPDRYLKKDQKSEPCTCSASEAKAAADRSRLRNVRRSAWGEVPVEPGRALHLFLQRQLQGEV